MPYSKHSDHVFPSYLASFTKALFLPIQNIPKEFISCNQPFPCVFARGLELDRITGQKVIDSPMSLYLGLGGGKPRPGRLVTNRKGRSDSEVYLDPSYMLIFDQRVKLRRKSY